MTYSLKGQEIISARVTSACEATAVKKLRWLGVQVYKGRDGTIMGQMMVTPASFESLDGVRIECSQRFKVVREERIQFLAPSPLARCRPVSFLSAQSHASLESQVAVAWQHVVGQARSTLDTARALSQNARQLLEPWRIEGTVQIGQDEVRVLFSSAGDRACVCGLNGRALVVQPVSPRVIVPVHNESPQYEQDSLWRAAIEQARSCLGRAVPVQNNDESLSLDLLSQDLESSYGPNANLMGPQLSAVITGVADTPPRMPPPRGPSPAPSMRTPAQPIAALTPRTIAAHRPDAEPPLEILPPFHVRADEDSLDLSSLDLDSIDLGSLDLVDSRDL